MLKWYDGSDGTRCEPKNRHVLVDARREQERLQRHHRHHAHVLGVEHEPGGDVHAGVLVGVELGDLVAEHGSEHLLATRARAW